VLATSYLESRDRVAVTMTGCEFCSGGDCGSGDCGAGEVAVGATEAVGSFKHSEVFKKMNFIFPAVGSGGFGGFGGGVIEEEVKLLTPICVLSISPPYIPSSLYVRNFPFD